MNVIDVNPLLASSVQRPKIRYRYPTEYWLLAGTLLVIGAAIVSSRVFSIGGFIFFFFTGLIINFLIIRAVVENFKRQSVQVTKTQFPEINTLVEECRQYIDIPRRTKVFVTYSPYMNAFAFGLGAPYAIVLFSALVDNLDRDELKSVIAHEMGHIHFGHTVWLTLIGQLGTQTYGLPLFGPLFRLCFLFWSRAAEMSADRAGLVACGRLEKVISTEIKLGAGPLVARWANAEALARQAREARISFWGSLGEMFGTHPTMVTRIRRLVEFAASETFGQLRPDAGSTNDGHGGGWSVNGVTPNGTGPASPNGIKPQRKLRRLKSKPKPAVATVAERNGPPITKRRGSSTEEPMFEPGPSDSGETKEVKDAPQAESTPPDWPQESDYQRLNIAAMRANANQADVWLKLGELFQSQNQNEQATTCLNRAKVLMTGSLSADHFAFPTGEPALVPAHQPWEGAFPSKTESICPRCGTVNPNQARFCYRCQASLQRVCLQCAVLLPANHPNCTACGQNQAQAISTLKAEAEIMRQAAKEPLPPRMLTWWEIVFGVIFMIDIVIVMSVLGWQVRDTETTIATIYVGSAVLLPLIGIIVGTVWARRRVRRYWRVFDQVEGAVRRYNEIAGILVQQNIKLDPEHLTPRDPWNWT